MTAALLQVEPGAATSRVAAFLGVEASACGRVWAQRMDRDGEMMAAAIAQSHGVPDVVARVLAGRGVDVGSTAIFLAPRLRDLMPDPDVLQDMPAAVARLARAVTSG
jgi:single-stranded-DNA-specific exonuclease